MEAFVLALIAVSNLYKEQRTLEPEAEFQPFDLNVLTPLYDAKDKSAGRSTDRRASFVTQSAS
jgi:hypothetical protein